MILVQINDEEIEYELDKNDLVGVFFFQKQITLYFLRFNNI